MKTFIAMLAIVTVAVCAPSLYSQTYKPDYATKLVLAGGGTSLVNTTTLLAPAGSSFTLTLPGATGSSGYILTTDGAGVMSWTNPATGVVLAGDVTGSAGSNTVAKINGVTLGSTAGTSGNLLIGQGTSWVSTAVTGDVTILNTGVTAIGTNKVTNSQFRQSAALSVVGNATNATANVADITASADGQVLRRSGTTLSFGTIGTSGLTPGANNTFLTTNNSGTVGWNALNVDGVTLTGDGSNSALAIKSTYAGQTSITTLGTIGTGTWQGSIVAPQYGGTGLNTSATATGSMLYTSAAGTWSTVGIGSTGQVLTVSGGIPSWQNAGASITLGPSTTNNISTATTNNFGPIVANQGIIYLQNSTGASSDLTGIAGGTAGRMIVLVNNSALAADVIVLKDKNAGSTSTNQFHLQGGSDIVLGVDGTVTMVYDANATNSVGATGAWRVIAGY